MGDDQERIQQSLKEVRLKAAQQRLILESTLEKSGHSIQPMRTEDENDSSRDVDMSGPSAQAVTIERQQEKARGVVLAVQVLQYFIQICTCSRLYLRSDFFRIISILSIVLQTS